MISISIHHVKSVRAKLQHPANTDSIWVDLRLTLTDDTEQEITFFFDDEAAAEVFANQIGNPPEPEPTRVPLEIDDEIPF